MQAFGTRPGFRCHPLHVRSETRSARSVQHGICRQNTVHTGMGRPGTGNGGRLDDRDVEHARTVPVDLLRVAGGNRQPANPKFTEAFSAGE